MLGGNLFTGLFLERIVRVLVLWVDCFLPKFEIEFLYEKTGELGGDREAADVPVDPI